MTTDPMTTDPMTTQMTLQETADTLATHAAAERLLFEVAGEWSTGGSEPRCRGFFSEQSAFAAWRGEQWVQRLPRSVEAEMRWKGEVRIRLSDELLGLSEDVDRVAVWAGVLLPALQARYVAHRARLGVPADRGLERVLGLALHDVRECLGEGTALAGNILSTLSGCSDCTDEFAELAAVHQRRIEPLVW